MNQLSIPLKDKRRPLRSTKRIKRADELPGLPMTEHQIEWAIGHNLQWLLSIVQTPNQPQ